MKPKKMPPPKKLKAEKHEYDHKRPVRPVVSRYTGSAGAAY